MALLRTRFLIKNQRSVWGLSCVSRTPLGWGLVQGWGLVLVWASGLALVHTAHLLRTKAGMALGGQVGVGRGRVMTYGNASGLQGPAE